MTTIQVLRVSMWAGLWLTKVDGFNHVECSPANSREYFGVRHAACGIYVMRKSFELKFNFLIWSERWLHLLTVRLKLAGKSQPQSKTQKSPRVPCDEEKPSNKVISVERLAIDIELLMWFATRNPICYEWVWGWSQLWTTSNFSS